MSSYLFASDLVGSDHGIMVGTREQTRPYGQEGGSRQYGSYAKISSSSPLGVDERKFAVDMLNSKSMSLENFSGGSRSPIVKSLECGLGDVLDWAFVQLLKLCSVYDVISEGMPNTQKSTTVMSSGSFKTSKFYNRFAANQNPYLLGMESVGSDAGLLNAYDTAIRDHLKEGVLMTRLLEHTKVFFDFVSLIKCAESEVLRDSLDRYSLALEEDHENYYYGYVFPKNGMGRSRTAHFCKWVFLRMTHIVQILVYLSKGNMSTLVLMCANPRFSDFLRTSISLFIEELFPLINNQCLDRDRGLVRALESLGLLVSWMSLCRLFFDLLCNLSPILPLKSVFQNATDSCRFVGALIDIFAIFCESDCFDESTICCFPILSLELLPRLLIHDENTEGVLRTLMEDRFSRLLLSHLRSTTAMNILLCLLDCVFQITETCKYKPSLASLVPKDWFGKLAMCLFGILTESISTNWIPYISTLSCEDAVSFSRFGAVKTTSSSGGIFTSWMTVHQKILKWLAVSYQPVGSVGRKTDVCGGILGSDMYNQFLAWAREQSIDPLPTLSELLPLILQIFPRATAPCQISSSDLEHVSLKKKVSQTIRFSCRWGQNTCEYHANPTMQGLKSLVHHLLFSEGHDVLAAAENDVFDCQWGGCSAMFSNRTDMYNHLLIHIVPDDPQFRLDDVSVLSLQSISEWHENARQSETGATQELLSVPGVFNLRPRNMHQEKLLFSQNPSAGSSLPSNACIYIAVDQSHSSLHSCIVKIFSLLIESEKDTLYSSTYLSLLNEMRMTLQSHIEAISTLSILIDPASSLGKTLLSLLGFILRGE